MRAVFQRITSAKLYVDGDIISEVAHGLYIPVGICKSDTMENVSKMAHKIATIRLFDREDKIDDSIIDVGGQVLLVSNFTLCNTGKHSGARPDFSQSASKEKAEELYNALANELKSLGVDVYLGVFGANMQIKANMDGPITVYWET